MVISFGMDIAIPSVWRPFHAKHFKETHHTLDLYCVCECVCVCWFFLSSIILSSSFLIKFHVAHGIWHLDTNIHKHSEEYRMITTNVQIRGATHVSYSLSTKQQWISSHRRCYLYICFYLIVSMSYGCMYSFKIKTKQNALTNICTILREMKYVYI